MPPAYQVLERTYSWGMHVQLIRHGYLVMYVDLYNDGDYYVDYVDNPNQY